MTYQVPQFDHQIIIYMYICTLIYIKCKNFFKKSHKIYLHKKIWISCDISQFGTFSSPQYVTSTTASSQAINSTLIISPWQLIIEALESIILILRPSTPSLCGWKQIYIFNYQNFCCYHITAGIFTFFAWFLKMKKFKRNLIPVSIKNVCSMYFQHNMFAWA